MSSAALLAGGFAMGLAGSLHCSCVCGGIASSLLLASRPDASDPAAQLRALAAIQAGRAGTYTLGGALIASAGSSFSDILHLAGLQSAARFAAAALIVTVGLSIAGVLPQRYVSGFASAVSGRIRRAIPRRAVSSLPFASGMAWGLAPCGMVYNALLMAAVAGSTVNGALFMSGFALATIPAVSAAAYGSVRAVSRGVRVPSGLALKGALGGLVVALGFASLVVPPHSALAICLSK